MNEVLHPFEISQELLPCVCVLSGDAHRLQWIQSRRSLPVCLVKTSPGFIITHELHEVRRVASLVCGVPLFAEPQKARTAAEEHGAPGPAVGSPADSVVKITPPRSLGAPGSLRHVPYSPAEEPCRCLSLWLQKVQQIGREGCLLIPTWLGRPSSLPA